MYKNWAVSNGLVVLRAGFGSVHQENKIKKQEIILSMTLLFNYHEL